MNDPQLYLLEVKIGGSIIAAKHYFRLDGMPYDHVRELGMLELVEWPEGTEATLYAKLGSEVTVMGDFFFQERARQVIQYTELKGRLFRGNTSTPFDVSGCNEKSRVFEVPAHTLVDGWFTD